MQCDQGNGVFATGIVKFTLHTEKRGLEHSGHLLELLRAHSSI